MLARRSSLFLFLFTGNRNGKEKILGPGKLVNMHGRLQTGKTEHPLKRDPNVLSYRPV